MPAQPAPPLRHTEGGLVIATPDNLAWLLSRPGPPARVWWEQAELELCLVEAGSFPMGSAEGVGRRNERPQHEVHLDVYYISRVPVTQGHYQRFVRATGHRAPYEKPGLLNLYDEIFNWNQERRTPPKGRKHHPVVLVDWSDASAFCEWAGLRLPSEAEWEKAASWDPGTRTKRIYPWGDEWDPALCTWSGTPGQTTPVGQYSPAGDSPYGCADMAGNAWEWVADWYSRHTYRRTSLRNPSGPSDGVARVRRGGAWSEGAKDVRCARRADFHPTMLSPSTGFRCAVSAPRAQASDEPSGAA